jgi:hypothetical protein
MATFKEAFAKARKEKGPNATFTWEGKSYSTARADDTKKTKAPPARPASRAASPAPARPANLKTPRVDRDQQSGPKAAPSKPVQEDRATRIAKPSAPSRAVKDDKVTPAKPAKARTPAKPPAKKPATQFMDFLRGGGFGGKEARRKADERQAKQNRR